MISERHYESLLDATNALRVQLFESLVSMIEDESSQLSTTLEEEVTLCVYVPATCIVETYVVDAVRMTKTNEMSFYYKHELVCIYDIDDDAKLSVDSLLLILSMCH